MIYFLKNDTVRKNCIQDLNALDLNKYWVEIKEKDYKKTIAQRGYWHVILGILAKDSGHTKEHLKVGVKKSVLEPVPAQDTEGNTHLCIPSSEDLTLQEYSDLIEATIELFGIMGFTPPSKRRHGLD